MGAGGDALVVNGFGTEAVIYGGEFVGGTGVASMGYSVKVMNSASVHIHGGTFVGGMMVEGGAAILLHGCFSTSNNETQVSGLFADETEISVAVKKEGNGYIDFVSMPGQECDTAPSFYPTSFSTLSPQPTAYFCSEKWRKTIDNINFCDNVVSDYFVAKFPLIKDT